MFHYEKDMDRMMQAKKREILKELEETKDRIIQELSGVDKMTMTRLREILADYNRIDYNINQKISNIENVANDTKETVDEFVASEELTNITKNENKRVLLITDSYGTKENFVEMFRTACNFKELYTKCYSGGGFYGNGVAIDFIAALNQITPTITNPELITDIIVLGGFNDATYLMNNQGTVNSDTLSRKVAEFANKCFDYFPNAIINLGMVGWCVNINNMENYTRLLAFDVPQGYRKGVYYAKHHNLKFMENMQYAIRGLDCVDNSKYHPNANGNIQIIRGVLECLHGDSADFFHVGDCVFELPNQYNRTVEGALTMYLKNSITTITAHNIFVNAENAPISLGSIENVDSDAPALFKLNKYIALPYAKTFFHNVQIRYMLEGENTYRILNNAGLILDRDGYVRIFHTEPTTLTVTRLKIMNLHGIFITC